MPSGFLPGVHGTAYLVGSIVLAVVGLVLAVLTFTGMLGGGIVLGVLWIVVALAGGLAVVDAARKS